MIRLLITIALLIASFGALAATCQKTNSVCVDAAPCKTISGVQVCLTDPGVNSTCWQYTDTYTCLMSNAVDYCAALKQTAGCSQTSSVCATNDTLFNTGCMEWTNIWRCGNPSLSTPTSTIQLDNSYTLTTDTLNNTQCQTYTDNPGCTLASHTCVEPAETRNINGLDVYQDCWSWQDDYTCIGQMQSDCAALQARGCTLGTSTCIMTASDGQCSLTEKVYQCQSSAGTTSSVMDCGTQQYCVGGNCFDAGHTPDPDFAKTAAMMEATREAGNYMDPATMRLFGGENSSCKKKLFGLVNCCKGSGGGAAMSNSAVMGFALQAGGHTRDHTGTKGRFHHITYALDTREEILRAADIFLENGVHIETGPHKHAIQQTFFLYVYEPGGNRVEVANAGARLILAPDWKPIRWTEDERAKGQAWGLKTIESFHTHGTPPVEAKGH